MGTIFWILVIGNALIGAFFCGFVAEQKGRDYGSWFFLGLLFGLFALLALGFTPPANIPSLGKDKSGQRLADLRKKCPACAEQIKLEAVKCRYCGNEFDPGEVDEEIRRGVREELAKEPLSLHAACQAGDIAVVEILLDSGVAIVPDSKGYSSLYYTIVQGQLEIARLLLVKKPERQRANPNFRVPSPTGGDHTLLWEAVNTGQPDMVRLLLVSGARPTTDFGYCSELALAIEQGRTEIAHILIEHGAELNKSALLVHVTDKNSETVAIFQRMLNVREAERVAKEDAEKAAREAERAMAKREKAAEKYAKRRAEELRREAIQRQTSTASNEVRFVCPECKQSLKIPSKYAGVTGRCNHCGSRITIAIVDPA